MNVNLFVGRIDIGFPVGQTPFQIGENLRAVNPRFAARRGRRPGYTESPNSRRPARISTSRAEWLFATGFVAARAGKTSARFPVAAGKDRHQVNAIQPGDRPTVGSRGSQERGRKVHGDAGWLIDFAGRQAGGPAQQAGNPNAAFQSDCLPLNIGELSEKSGAAVVAGEHHQRVVAQALLVELGKEQPHAFVDFAEHARIRGPIAVFMCRCSRADRACPAVDRERARPGVASTAEMAQCTCWRINLTARWLSRSVKYPGTSTGCSPSRSSRVPSI